MGQTSGHFIFSYILCKIEQIQRQGLCIHLRLCNSGPHLGSHTQKPNPEPTFRALDLLRAGIAQRVQWLSRIINNIFQKITAPF